MRFLHTERRHWRRWKGTHLDYRVLDHQDKFRSVVIPDSFWLLPNLWLIFSFIFSTVYDDTSSLGFHRQHSFKIPLTN